MEASFQTPLQLWFSQADTPMQDKEDRCEHQMKR